MSQRRAGRFELIRKLGEGSIGVVYEAHDREQDIRVALKMLRRMVPAGLYRLKQEFRALRSLRHPNIVTLHELVSENGSWFITMELIEGKDFIAYVRKGRAEIEAIPQIVSDSMLEGWPDAPCFGDLVDESRFRHVLAQLAQALHAMHLAGLIHRDLKPSNVRVTELGRAVLMDFSIVAEAQNALDSTGSGNIMVGTPFYMAPEQAAGDPPHAAIDWYALGVMMYQAMTGRLPFEGFWDQVILDKQELDPVPPSDIVAQIPRDLEELCLALLSRHPHERPRGDEILRQLGMASDDAASVLHGKGESAFVGREQELDRLQRAQSEAASGECVCVIACGEPGIGKTKLLGRFVQKLMESPSEPVIVLRGDCRPHDRRSFNAFDEIMDALSRALLELPHERLMHILPRGVEYVPLMFPAFLRVPGIDSAPRASGVNLRELRARAVDALRQLLVSLAAWRRLVLCMDDMQWADADSLALLHELLRPSPPRRILLLLAVETLPGSRAGEDAAHDQDAGHARLAELMNIAALAHVHCVELSGLPGPDQRVLVQQLLGGDTAMFGASELVHTRGSPLFLSELIRCAVETRADETSRSADNVDDVLARRIDHLPAASRALLEVIALAGEPAPLSLLAQAADQRVGDVEQASANLRAARLIIVTRPGRDPWLTTYHQKIRERVAAGLAQERRRELHHRLALAFQRSSNGTSDVLAHHWQEAGEARHALSHLRSAAQGALDRLAFARAATLHAALLDECEPAHAQAVARSLGDSLSLAGHNLDAAAAYERAARHAEDEHVRSLECLAAEHRLRGGHIEAGLEALVDIADALGAPVRAASGGQQPVSLMQRMRIALRGRLHRVRSESEIASRDLDRLDTLYRATLCMGLIDPARGQAVQAEHLLTALRHGEPLRVARAMACDLAFVLSRGERHLARGHELAERLLADAERLADPHLTGLVHLATGLWRVAAGSFGAAEQSLDHAIRTFSVEVGDAYLELACARYLFCLARMGQGRLAEVMPMVEQALDQARRAGDSLCQTMFACTPSMWRLMCLDQVGEALALLDEIHARWPPADMYTGRCLIEKARAMGHLYIGCADKAEKALAVCLERLQSLRLAEVPAVMIDIHSHRGRAALVRGDDAGVAGAAQKLVRMQSALARAHAALLHAGLAHGAGQDDRAREYLNEAITGFDTAGAAHYGMSAKFRLGHVLGPPEGASLIAEAMAWCAHEGIANAGRMFDYLLPWTRTVAVHRDSQGG